MDLANRVNPAASNTRRPDHAEKNPAPGQSGKALRLCRSGTGPIQAPTELSCSSPAGNNLPAAFSDQWPQVAPTLPPLAAASRDPRSQVGAQAPRCRRAHPRRLTIAFEPTLYFPKEAAGSTAKNYA